MSSVSCDVQAASVVLPYQIVRCLDLPYITALRVSAHPRGQWLALLPSPSHGRREKWGEPFCSQSIGLILNMSDCKEDWEMSSLWGITGLGNK